MEILRQALIGASVFAGLFGFLAFSWKTNKATPRPEGSPNPEDMLCEGCKAQGGCKFTF